MSLLDVLRSGIKLADKIVKPLESDVVLKRFVRKGDGYTTGTYPYAPVTLKAIVEWKEVEVPSGAGTVTASRPVITFLDYAALMAATAGEGIKDEDVLILADGTTGPVRTRSGFMDAVTGKSMYTEVYLG